MCQSCFRLQVKENFTHRDLNKMGVFFSPHHDVQTQTVMVLGQWINDVTSCLCEMKFLECFLSHKMAAATRHDVHIQGRKRSEETVLATFAPLLGGKGQIFPRNPAEFHLKLNLLSQNCIMLSVIAARSGDVSIQLGTLPQKTMPEFYQQKRRGKRILGRQTRVSIPRTIPVARMHYRSPSPFVLSASSSSSQHSLQICFPFWN